jgi:hypothetical protein
MHPRKRKFFCLFTAIFETHIFRNRDDRELQAYLRKKMQQMQWALRNFSFMPKVSNPVKKAKDGGVMHSWSPWTVPG